MSAQTALDRDNHGLAAEYAAALAWWREAGVDHDFSDDPQGWLSEEEPQTPEAPPPRTVPRHPETDALERALTPAPPPSIGPTREAWPDTLEAFAQFWLHEPSIEPGALTERVAPRGNAGASVMVIVGQPEEGDREVLLAGAQGKMLSAILRAIGEDDSQTYIASALPRVTPLPDWSVLAQAGLGELTRHHIGLVAPKRVLVFGRSMAPLFGGEAGPQLLAVKDNAIPLLIAPALETLARSPGQRQRFWTHWLNWTRR
ncbi:MAG: hypothetical protein ABGW87_05000 [Sphingomonadaceae bacterium]